MTSRRWRLLYHTGYCHVRRGRLSIGYPCVRIQAARDGRPLFSVKQAAERGHSSQSPCRVDCVKPCVLQRLVGFVFDESMQVAWAQEYHHMLMRPELLEPSCAAVCMCSRGHCHVSGSQNGERQPRW